MNRLNAPLRSSATAMSTRRLGAVLLGLATLATGCGPQDAAPAQSSLQGVTQGVSTDSAYAVIYAGDTYTGLGHNLLPGDYKAQELGGVGDNNVSSLTVPPGWRVRLYDADNFGGTPAQFTQDTDLQGQPLNDKTSSIRVEGPVTVFRDAAYTAEARHLTFGTYASLESRFEDAISSIHVARGWKVLLYPNANLGGTPLVITADTQWLGDLNFNDMASSIVVQGPVSLHPDANYTGGTQTLKAGFYPRARLALTDKTLSSLKVGSGWTVTLYENDNFTGAFRIITADTSFLNDFNDKTTSIKVEGPFH